MSNCYLQFTRCQRGFNLQLLCQTEQQESSFRGAPKGCDPKLQSYCSVFQKKSESQVFAAALHWCYCHHSLPTFSHMVQGSPGEGMEQYLIPNPVWKPGSPVLSAHQAQEEIWPTVVQSWPHSSLQRACSWRAFHGGVKTHQDNNAQLCTETGDHTGELVALFAFGRQSLMVALSHTGFWGTALTQKNLSWFSLLLTLLLQECSLTQLQQ